MHPNVKKSLTLSALLVLLLAFGGLLAWVSTAKSRQCALRVRQLVTPKGDDNETRNALGGLVALGPDAYPELRRLLAWHETAATRAYRKFWNVLPANVRDRLPRPDAQALLQKDLFQSLEYTGPTICRAMTGPLCDAIDRQNNYWDPMKLLRPLLWAIPDSPRAVSTLSNYLARSTNQAVFGTIYAYDVWPKVPALAPFLAEWLKKPDAVHDVAQSLGALGTNASFAVPLLVQTAIKGVAGEPPDLKFRNRDAFEDPVLMNRRVAVEALGKIGVTNSAVAAVLRQAAESSDDELSGIALVASLRLGLPVPPWSETRVKAWDPAQGFMSRNYRAIKLVQKMGELGPDGKPAIPLLVHVYEDLGGDFRTVAICSLFQISPERARPYLPYLLERFTRWEAAEVLSRWTSARDEIVPALAKKMEAPFQQFLSAYILMAVAPEMEEPKQTLFSALHSPNPSERGMAANWLWTLTADVPRILPIAQELLNNTRDDDIQSALNVLERMGDAALPAVPALKRLLDSPHWGVRDRAGRLLRKLAPHELPPIID